MKKVYEETVVKTQMWEAIDGQRFPTQEECERYEKSAEVILKSRFKKLIVNSYNAWDLYGGYEDNTVHVVKINTEKDIETILHLYYYQNPHLLDDKYKENRVIYEAQLTNAKGDYYLIGENIDGDLYLIKSVREIMLNLTGACKKQ